MPAGLEVSPWAARVELVHVGKLLEHLADERGERVRRAFHEVAEPGQRVRLEEADPQVGPCRAVRRVRAGKVRAHDIDEEGLLVGGVGLDRLLALLNLVGQGGGDLQVPEVLVLDVDEPLGAPDRPDDGTLDGEVAVGAWL